MKNLIKFELRKILTKTLCGCFCCCRITIVVDTVFFTLHSMYAFDGNGTEETGKAAVEIDKQIALKYEGNLTEQ